MSCVSRTVSDAIPELGKVEGLQLGFNDDGAAS